MQQNGPKSAAIGRLIGCARVSTEDQGSDPQCDELRAAGCAVVLEEHALGADRSRPVLARLTSNIRSGEVVTRFDRLARSVRHLLAFNEQLETKRAAFAQLTRPDRHNHAAGHVLLQVGTWGDVVRVLNRGQPRRWAVERLRYTVRRLVTEGILKASLLERARPQRRD